MTFFFLAILTAWTNTAGRIIHAEPVKIEGASVSLTCGASGVRTVPLSVFPPSEQRRLKEALGIRELPRSLAGVRAVFAADLARAEQRHTGGAMSDDDFNKTRSRILGAWAHALAQAQLSDEDRQYWQNAITPPATDVLRRGQ